MKIRLIKVNSQFEIQMLFGQFWITRNIHNCKKDAEIEYNKVRNLSFLNHRNSEFTILREDIIEKFTIDALREYTADE